MKHAEKVLFERGTRLFERRTACSTVPRTPVTNHLTGRALSAFHFFLVIPVILLQHSFNRSLLGTGNEQCIVGRSPSEMCCALHSRTYIPPNKVSQRLVHMNWLPTELSILALN